MKKAMLTPVERAVKSKRRIIQRLQERIADEKRSTAEFVSRLEKKIQIQRVLIAALENGDISAQ